MPDCNTRIIVRLSDLDSENEMGTAKTENKLAMKSGCRLPSPGCKSRERVTMQIAPRGA